MNEGTEKRLVRVSNVMIDGSFKLNMVEQKLLYFALYNYQRSGKTSNQVVMSLSDVVEFLGAEKNKNAFSYIKKIFLGMRSHFITFKLPKKSGVSSFISSATINDTRTEITIEFPYAILDFISGDLVKCRYTSLDVDALGTMSNKYVARMYSLLERYSFSGKWKISIESLCNILRVPASYLKNKAMINTDILKQVIPIINSSTDLDIKLNITRIGNRLKDCIFGITKEVRELPVKQMDFDKMVEAGVSTKRSIYLLKKYSMYYVLEDVLEALKEKQILGIKIRSIDAFVTRGAAKHYQPKTKMMKKYSGERGVSFHGPQTYCSRSI